MSSSFLPVTFHLRDLLQRRIVARLDELQAKSTDSRDTKIRTTEELDVLLPSVLDRAFWGASSDPAPPEGIRPILFYNFSKNPLTPPGR
ncbi:MAG TPA: hypothetical protein PLM24_02225 [Methanothrix sp.]|nr:hypothetical protein [Methanothrix sp.]HPJ84863.1 hypothetical protein [Methanothrix sp.]HPR65936.1 hypothetical protein [Methanothrix sp.]